MREARVREHEDIAEKPAADSLESGSARTFTWTTDDGKSQRSFFTIFNEVMLADLEGKNGQRWRLTPGVLMQSISTSTLQ